MNIPIKNGIKAHLQELFATAVEMDTTLFASGDAYYIVQASRPLPNDDLNKLEWLLDAPKLKESKVSGKFVGPRREMVSPWSSNATDISKNVGIEGVTRIEVFQKSAESAPSFDPMLEEVYNELSSSTLEISAQPEKSFAVEDIAAFNKQLGLALSQEEIDFLQNESKRLKRLFTDAELFSFAQINSEHCRHKIFNGTFVLDGKTQESSLFALIKQTSKHSPKNIVSAYSDNVAFIHGPDADQFAPTDPSTVSRYGFLPAQTVLSLKAETHNFPTTVEPFNGASTGSGGEIRDRMAGGIGSVPLVGTAVYMTSYSRLRGTEAQPELSWEKTSPARIWKYQSPSQILVKASNGASDFGNKFGQPLIVGSVLTFEGTLKLGGGKSQRYAYDRTVMLAGGVGYARREYALKAQAQIHDALVLMGGDNYRIGLAGGSVSSVDTGKASRAIELSAIQRANPEMQKRVFNVVRALAEQSSNPIRLIHDHGAGGHLNCFAELLDPLGGEILVERLPLGDTTLSVREIASNESQERMGLIISPTELPLIQAIATRERAPLYVVGSVTGSQTLVLRDRDCSTPVNLPMEVLLGSAPKTVLEDKTVAQAEQPVPCALRTGPEFLAHLQNVLRLESVACKDWLTNKVDRCVTGRVVQQQNVGPLHLPLSNVGVVALDYTSKTGIASSVGHASIPGLIEADSGAVLSVAEALTNIVWAPLSGGLRAVVLSANWMWPAKQSGEDVRLYQAVKALSEFCIKLGIAVPTGKDSLSMTMRYENGEAIRAPGTVVVSAAAQCSNILSVVTPDLKPVSNSTLLYVDLSSQKSFPLGGSAFAQTLGVIGSDVPHIESVEKFASGFEVLQRLVQEKLILSGHDISSGGLAGAVSEMCFTGDMGASVQLKGTELDDVRALFSEKPGVVLQVQSENISKVQSAFLNIGLEAVVFGNVGGKDLSFELSSFLAEASVEELRAVWFETSALLDARQTRPDKAQERKKNFSKQRLDYVFPASFTGRSKDSGIDLRRSNPTGLHAAVIREQGTNGEREMAFSLHAAGFDVRDVTMSDLITGAEDLKDVSFAVFPGGFANSDVLGAGRGWAGVFRFHPKAMEALSRFYARPDTLSLGVCNGCQLVVQLGLVYPEHKQHPRMRHNESQKFESTFVSVDVQETQSVLLQPLIGSRLGIWVAHGEGRFELPASESQYDIPVKYAYAEYPGNPNGADYNAAAICSKDGRHLAIMPHLERSALPQQWAYYPHGKLGVHDVSPWMSAFVAARKWVESRR